MDWNTSMSGRRPFALDRPSVAAATLASGLVACPCLGQESISVETDVTPVLQEYCVSCHTPGGECLMVSGLDLETYDGLLQGTSSGPVVIPGDVTSSNLLRLIMGQASAEIRMPHDGRPIPQADVRTLMRWVQQGALDN